MRNIRLDGVIYFLKCLGLQNDITRKTYGFQGLIRSDHFLLIEDDYLIQCKRKPAVYRFAPYQPDKSVFSFLRNKKIFFC